MMRTMATASRPRNEDEVTKEYLQHSHAERINTDVTLTAALRRKYPNLHVVSAPVDSTSLLSWAQATGEASFTPLEDDDPVLASISWRVWVPPASRNATKGGLVDMLKYGRFLFKWKKHEFLLYIAEGRDGTSPYPILSMNYIIYSDKHAIDALIIEASSWQATLYDAIWVFDQGYWRQSTELYQEIQKANWDAVILDEDMKKAIRHDIEDFYESGDRYERLKVPWKRGLIFHGPPGNGKTISIKATMHELMLKKPAIPTMYVRSLTAFGGPEYAVSSIFSKARQEAPCFLVFEDLDSIVTDDVRSYFLNEVDGLRANNGVLMVGSTNHLDQLDPGLSKRPSRFDRKYFFPDPNLEQRTMYAQFWQKKLEDTPSIEFPDKLCPAVAGITEGFSFAYMQEAFVAALLVLARREDEGDDAVLVPHGDEGADYAGLTQAAAAAEYVKIMQSVHGKKKIHEQLLARLESRGSGSNGDDDDGEPDIEDLPLWRELKTQVANLREGLDDSGAAGGGLDALPRPGKIGFAGGPSMGNVRAGPFSGISGISASNAPAGLRDRSTTDPTVLDRVLSRAEQNGWTGTLVLDH